MEKEKKETLQDLALALMKEKSELNLKKLYNRIKPGLIHYATGILKDKESAEDVVSEAFVKIWNRMDQYDPYWNFSTWAYRIVYHESLLFMRKSNQKKLVSFDDITPTQIRTYVDKTESLVPDSEVLEAEMNVHQLIEAIHTEIHNLPDDYRDIMIDREIKHKQYKEIEETHDTRKNNVKTKIRRARMLIKKNLEEKFPHLVKSYEEYL
jgi:RNA polymerase sigma-70 factor (ECF subfamily)